MHYFIILLECDLRCAPPLLSHGEQYRITGFRGNNERCLVCLVYWSIVAVLRNGASNLHALGKVQLQFHAWVVLVW